MADVSKGVFFFGGFVEVLEVTDGHGHVEYDLAALLLRLIDQFRRLRPREPGNKHRGQQQQRHSGQHGLALDFAELNRVLPGQAALPYQ
jgi:hypothetical protein